MRAFGGQSAYLAQLAFSAGLVRRNYSGYFNDDVNWFSTATFTGSGINVTGINYSAGADLYSNQWLGYFKPIKTDTYTMYTNSDDASYLWVGDTAITGFTTVNAIVNNGSQHGMQERSGTVTLNANVMYPIRVQFGENLGGDQVIMYYSNSVTSKTEDFTGLLFYNPATNAF